MSIYSKFENRWARVLANEPRSVIAELTNLENEKAAAYISANLLGSETLVFSSPEKFRNHFFSSEYLGKDGLVLDFGVRRGGSTYQIGNALKENQHVRKVFGFDAFLGIRNNWSKIDRPAGSMDMGGIPPARLTTHPNIQLEIRWVEDTLPPFLQKFQGPVDFVHLDFDVYGPTAFALSSVTGRLRMGSVIVFDDFFGFPGWANHSVRAFEEKCSHLNLLCLGVSEKQAAFRLI